MLVALLFFSALVSLHRTLLLLSVSHDHKNCNELISCSYRMDKNHINAANPNLSLRTAQPKFLVSLPPQSNPCNLQQKETEHSNRREQRTHGAERKNRRHTQQDRDHNLAIQSIVRNPLVFVMWTIVKFLGTHATRCRNRLISTKTDPDSGALWANAGQDT